MANVRLSTFIAANRDELIGRCRQKMSARHSVPPTGAEIDHGVSLLLSQLTTELDRVFIKTSEISEGAREHGRELLERGFTIDQAVRNYGDVCQSLTELAIEKNTAISAEDFRKLNKCLDEAMAEAVTEFAREQDNSRDGERSELWSLITSAAVSFEILKMGSVGIEGSTGAVLGRSLAGLRSYMDRETVNAKPEGGL